MPQYRVPIQTLATAYVTVEAEDETDAIEKSAEVHVSIRAQCSGWGQAYSLDLGEWTSEGFTVQDITEADAMEVEL
jgi:endogenous inhibitor of DNA gyrase (YacG/DUF329 family)